MVAQGRPLQPLLQGVLAGRGDVVLHRPLNEATALAGPGETVDGLDRGFRQNDVDTLCHGSTIYNLLHHIVYTRMM
jgi:hypothetical protein